MEDQPGKSPSVDEQAAESSLEIQEIDRTPDEGIVRNIDELKELIDENHPDVKPEDILWSTAMTRSMIRLNCISQDLNDRTLYVS